MEQQFIDSFQPINEAIGISSSLMWLLAFFAVAIIQLTVSYRITGSIIVPVILNMCLFIFGVALKLIPAWTTIIIFIVSVIYVSYRFFSNNVESNKKSKRIVKTKVTTKREKLIERLEEYSQQFEQYHNNLDELLGIKTRIVLARWDKGILDDNSLVLKDGVLEISKYYDWYIIDKHPILNIFKIVGIDKSENDDNVAYLLGEKENKPFLNKLDSKDINDGKDIVELLKESDENNVMGSVLGLLFLVVGTHLSPFINESIKEVAKK
jgi:hypothetical protein